MLEEPTVEYFDELYGVALSVCNGKLKDHVFFLNKKVDYKKLLDNGKEKPDQIPFSEKIRHMIHHPENQLNGPWIEKDLIKAIEELREFIKFTMKQEVKAWFHRRLSDGSEKENNIYPSALFFFIPKTL